MCSWAFVFVHACAFVLIYTVDFAAESAASSYEMDEKISAIRSKLEIDLKLERNVYKHLFARLNRRCDCITIKCHLKAHAHTNTFSPLCDAMKSLLNLNHL